MHVVFKYLYRSQRWYFRKLIATGGLFLGIDSSGKIDSSQKSIFLYDKFLSGTLRKRERARVLDEKSIPASKIEVLWAMGDSIHTRFQLGSFLVPTQFLVHTAASKIGPPL